MKKYTAKAKCKCCGEDFEYEEQERMLGEVPLRHFCGDYSNYAEVCHCKNQKFTDSYKSYIWLTYIYGDDTDYHSYYRPKLKPFYDKSWVKHYKTLSKRYSDDFREYMS